MTMQSIMKAVAAVLNDTFKGYGWCLLTFEFGKGERANYLSNTNREDMINALFETAYRLKEGQDGHEIQDLKYKIPKAVDPAKTKYEAGLRREALEAAGVATYVIGMREGHPSIMCMCCGLGSHHPQDIDNRFCGFCKRTHSEWAPGILNER